MLTEFWTHKGWLALVPLAIAALAFYAWIGIGAEARQMERSGIETEATIVDLRRTIRPAPTNVGNGTVPRVSSNYFATVMFSTGKALDGTLQIRQVEHFIDQAYYENASEGDRVWMRYLPDDPTRIELVRGGTQSNSNAAGWMSLGMAVCAALLGGLIWSQAAKVHRFKTEGLPAPATITAIIPQNGWTILALTLPDGREVRALPVKVAAGTYTPGATVTVLTTPDQPKLVMIPPSP